MVSSTLPVIICTYQLMRMLTRLAAQILGDQLVYVSWEIFDFVEVQEANHRFKVFY